MYSRAFVQLTLFDYGEKALPRHGLVRSYRDLRQQTITLAQSRLSAIWGLASSNVGEGPKSDMPAQHRISRFLGRSFRSPTHVCARAALALLTSVLRPR